MFGMSASTGCVVVSLLAASSSSGAFAQCELQAIQGASAQFGLSVAIDGDRAIVSSPGGPMVYRFDHRMKLWVEEAQLVGQGVSPGDYFGMTVDIDGDVAVVSASGDDTLAPNAGAIYVFRLNPDETTWTQEAKLPVLLPVSDHGLLFGTMLKVSGNGIAMRKINTKTVVFRYIESSKTWVQEALLSPSIGFGGSGMGMTLSDDMILVSYIYHCFGSGCEYLDFVDVFVYGESVWELQDTLLGGDADSVFGAVLDLHGDIAVIGGIEGGSNPGVTPEVEIWRNVNGKFVYEQTFLGDSDTPYWNLTQWLATDGDAVVFGDFAEVMNGGEGFAKTIVFDEASQSWQALSTLYPSNALITHTYFGESVAIDKGRIVIGAPLAQLPGGGWAYFFDLNQPDCNRNAICDSRDIAEGTSADDNADGIPDECEALIGDANGDGTVNVDDLLLVINSWGPCPAPCAADLTGDGIVDLLDLDIVLTNWTSPA